MYLIFYNIIVNFTITIKTKFNSTLQIYSEHNAAFITSVLYLFWLKNKIWEFSIIKYIV